MTAATLATFIADDGEEWAILASPSPCGAGYVDVVRVRDGKLSCRPVAVLRAAGLPVP